MCLSVRFASSAAARWCAGVAEHRFESQRNSRNALLLKCVLRVVGVVNTHIASILYNRIGKLDIYIYMTRTCAREIP